MNDPRKSGPSDSSNEQALFQYAHDGDAEALGRLMEGCRDYLLLVANQEMNRDLQAKVGASDVVQQSLAAAHEHFDQFHGTTPAELRAWLKTILVNNLRKTHRHYKKTHKRNVEREAEVVQQQLMDDAHTPGTQVIKQEQALVLRSAIEKLPADYQQIIELRNWQQLTFDEIGRRLGRSTDAARKLWSRAIESLQKVMQNDAPEFLSGVHRES